MDLERTKVTLDKAANLLGKLGGERSRWEDQVNELRKRKGMLPMETLVAAAFSTYLGKKPEDLRESAVDQWVQICKLERFDYRRLMSSESEQLIWKAEGLPADALSMQNAVIILNDNGGRVPFIIDPAVTATNWLKKNLGQDKKRPLEIVNRADPKFVLKVELAVRFGKTLMVVEADGVDPMLYPIVRQDLVHQGPRNVVQIGDKTIDYKEEFRLFIATRNPEPYIPPDASSLITEINFTVTRSGLEGQLLGVTIQAEQPELEEKKSKLLAEEEQYKVKLAELEKGLLNNLAESEGNLLDKPR